ncbi:ABC transporter ATP-binding protein [Patescibacteria group bacterium]|nr:ABC transporter ATP-binding protein [Patescibacteria group bacterium]MCL5091284.1 ABC transporter ATP-binding protein [Patescibacteria group bacterium]
MISVAGVEKTFAGKVAVAELSFRAKTGEIIGFLGPNGAGKTTTMRLLLGYLAPTRGKIEISGRDPRDQRMAVLRLMGYLPENNPLYTEMRVNEYLQFVAAVKSVPTIADKVRAVGLEEMLDKKIEELSRGYKQRVGLAAALLGDPQILVLDEPTSGLDPLEQDKIRRLIRQIAKNKIIIFSTHILSEVEDVATRLMIINHGRIVFDGKKPKGRGAVEKLFKKLVGY